MHLLLVEDSRRLQEAVSDGLRRSGYAVDVAGDGEAALAHARHHDYDVIVLDLMLPKLDGMTVLKRLRDERNHAHVLILTAKDAVEDRVLGLKSGADDYLIKPFAFDELLARVGALVRRRYDEKDPVLRVGSLAIDTVAQRVKLAGDELVLSPREYALLEYLAFRKDQVVTRREIEGHLYGQGHLPVSNAVDRVVCTLRRKIDSDSAGSLLATRRGQGYVLREPVPR